MFVRRYLKRRFKTSKAISLLALITLLLGTCNFFSNYRAPILKSKINIRVSPTKPRDRQNTWHFHEWERSCDIPDLLPSLRTYCKWHSQQKKCMLTHSCKLGKPKVLIWQCPFNKHSSCGGLGDRIRGIHFSLLLAIVLRRFFLVDWPDGPFPMDSGIIPGIIDWRMANLFDMEQIPIIEHQRLPYIQWRKCPLQYLCKLNATKYPKEIRSKNNILASRVRVENGDIESNLGQFDELIIVARAHVQSVEILSSNEKAMDNFKDMISENIDTFSLSRQLLQSLFQPSFSVRYELRERFNWHPHKEYISIHVRTGYDFGEMVVGRFEGLHQSRSDVASRFVHCAATLLKHDESQIFLASDSKIFKDDFLLASKKRNLSVYVSSLPSVHIGLGRGFPRNTNKGTQRMAHINTFVDFFAIAYSKIIITNGSGFSRLAYMLGKASHYIEVQSADDVGKCKMKSTYGN